MRASGTSGELRHGYQRAARLGPWVIARIDDHRPGRQAAFVFSAAMVDAHEIWIARRPIDLVLALGQVEWIWHDVELSIAGVNLTISLTRRPDVVGARVFERQTA